MGQVKQIVYKILGMTDGSDAFSMIARVCGGGCHQNGLNEILFLEKSILSNYSSVLDRFSSALN